MKTLTITLMLLALAVCAAPVQAYDIERAGEEVFNDFVVGPAKVELDLEPGTEKTVELSITNRMGEPRSFTLSVEDAQGSDDPNATVALLGDDRGPYSLRDYVSFPEQSFVLQHGERARVPVTISVPDDASAGGHYGSVLVTTTASDDAEGGNGAVIVSRIGALFFVTVEGDVEKSGELTEFSTIPAGKFVFGAEPIDFQLLFANTGSVHATPFGTVRITNVFGAEVGTVEVEPWYALPNSVRRREVSFDAPYLFGYYTAEASIDRGWNDIVDRKQVSFLVLPWKLVAMSIVILIVLALAARFLVRNFIIVKR